MLRAWHVPLSLWWVRCFCFFLLFILSTITTIITVVNSMRKLKPGEMKALSEIAQLWLVAKQSLPRKRNSGFFRFITLRQHYCLALKIYSTSWKIFELYGFSTFPNQKSTLMSKSLQHRNKLFRVKILKPNTVSLFALFPHI